MQRSLQGSNVNFRKLAVLAAVAAAIAAFVLLDLGRYLSLDYLKQSQAAFADLYGREPFAVAAAYFALYVVATALSFPGAAILTLAGGAVFGLGWGLLIVSFASSVGATLAFLAARFVLRGSVESRFGPRLAEINRGVDRDGAFYLFTLRLIPVVPFFVINLLMGLTRMRAWTFYWVSQLGMLAGTAVYVNAGTQLARIDSLRGILSPALLGSFVLLGVFPLLARRLIAALQKRKVYARWNAVRPRRFDRNLIVIGGGAGGLVSAYIAAAVKAQVTLVESHRMGGDCLNYGCVPSKALIKSAALAHQMRHAHRYGLQDVQPQFSFRAVMQRVQSVIAAIEPHDSIERYNSLGVQVLQFGQQTGALGLQPAHALLGCGHVGVGCGLYLHLRLAACLGCDLLVLCNRLTAGACCTPEPTQTQRRQRQQQPDIAAGMDWQMTRGQFCRLGAARIHDHQGAAFGQCLQALGDAGCRQQAAVGRHRIGAKHEQKIGAIDVDDRNQKLMSIHGPGHQLVWPLIDR